MIRKAAVLALLTLVAACGPEPARTTPETTTTTKTTGPPELTLAGLADDPCAAITDGQTAALGVFFEGTPDIQDAHACNWGLNSGVLLFKPFPDSDETARTPPAARNEIGGRPAAQVRTGRSCITVVTVADGQSFQLTVTSYLDAAMPADPCTVGVDWATAILSNLLG